jgi:ferric-dicitrate binding protein FerR (iron transport regulator)
MMNYGKDSEFYENAGRYLSGEMKLEEAEQFKALCDNNKQLSEELRKIQNIWGTAAEKNNLPEISIEKALEKVKRKTHFRGNNKLLLVLQRVAAILFIPLLLASLIYYYTNIPVREQKSVYNELDNAYGTVSKITLSDGTRVWLNSGSHFKYPNFFTGKNRKVYLSGEAYFEVAENKKKPFIVRVSEIDVIATGTVFSVTAYEDDSSIEATLSSGKIFLAKEVGKYNRLKTMAAVRPNQKAILDKEKKKINIKNANCKKAFAWKNGELIFVDDPMDVVIKKLNRWYNTDIVLVDEEVKNYRYTATFTGETLSQVLELLECSAPITYKYYKRKKLPDHTFSKAKVEIRLRQDLKKKTRP